MDMTDPEGRKLILPRNAPTGNLSMDMTDPEGRKLILPRNPDRLRHKAVWAAYKFRKDLQCAEARSSEFVDLTAAKATADALNGSRAGGKGCYFKVCRVAPLQAPEAEPVRSPVKINKQT